MKFQIIFSIEFFTFWVTGRQIYDLQQNEDHHENHKKILDQTGKEDFWIQFWDFMRKVGTY